MPRNNPCLPHAFSVATLCAALLVPAVASAVTYNVGAARTYHSPCALLTDDTITLNAGDVIMVDSGTYTEACTIDTISGAAGNPITLQGAAGARPVMSGTGQDLSGDGGGPRAVLQFANSNHWVVQHIEIANGTNPDMNAAGIRLTGDDMTSPSADIVLNDLYVHDNQVGVDTDTGAIVSITASEIAHNGVVGMSGEGQNLFLAGFSASLVGNYIHDSVGGQNVRLRMQYGELLYNTIANAADYEMDMVMDGDSETSTSTTVMLGNVLVRLATASNVEQTIVFGTGDPVMGTSASLYAAFNTFILCDGRNRLIRANPATPGATLVFSDNAVHGIPTAGFALDGAAMAYDDGTEAIFTGSNNWATMGITAASPLTATVTGVDPGFTSSTVFTLLPASPLIDQGVVPASYMNAMGMSTSGVPTLEPLSPMGTVARMILGPPDIGAYEALTRAIPMPDAGMSDDAGVDAGSVDSGVDAGGDGTVIVDASVVDAGSTDGSVIPVQDTGVASDVATASDVPTVRADGGASAAPASGCGCTVPGSTEGNRASMLGALFGVAVLARRRRRQA